MAIYRLFVPNWRPASLNQMIGHHWAVKAKAKRIDREMVAGYALLHRVPTATGKRLVSLEIVLKGRQKPTDDDNAFKSVLDALVQCQLLKDDSQAWCKLGNVVYTRHGEPGTTIILEDML